MATENIYTLPSIPTQIPQNGNFFFKEKISNSSGKQLRRPSVDRILAELLASRKERHRLWGN